MNIVAVDNSPHDLSQLRDAMTTILPDSRIQTFTDPLLSAKYICNNPVDVVFLTDVMGPANGVTLLRVLRKNIPKLAIIMLSKGDTNIADAISMGFDAYMCKPVSTELLSSVVQQLAV